MKYITAIINEKYMSIGGFGHVFYDILSAYIISNLFNLTFVYSPIQSLGEKHHKGELFMYKQDIIPWDSFLQFSNNELTLKDIENLNLNKINISLCKSFKSMDINKLEKFINSYGDDTLFILNNNNRVYLNELYYFNNNIYNRVFSKLKSKLEHLQKPKNAKLTIAMHIRRGDWDWQPLSYNVEFIKLLQSIKKNKRYVVNIYSLGTKKQLEEIKNLKKIDNNIVFHFNTNVFETFSGIFNADIVVGGHSNFPKIITIFSKNIFIYLPHKDGIIRALGTNNEFKLYHLGHYPELFDKENRIETDIYCKKNRELLVKTLSKF